MLNDIFLARDILKSPTQDFAYYRLTKLEELGHCELDRLPYTIRILLEAALRKCNDIEITSQDVINLAGWKANATTRPTMPFTPGRVLLQDFTGVPVIADLAAMRSAIARMGGDPNRINPIIPVDLVIDHSIQVDVAGSPDALRRNTSIEFQRNRERYEFLHWGKSAFHNLRVIPPSSGIVHQVNIEFLSHGVLTSQDDQQIIVFPDTLVGTDSHTTMVNGLGVLGWGVGGIEAAAAMLGQPIEMPAPDVIGFKLSGEMPEGTTPMDLTLRIVEILRCRGVVGKLIEFYGPGLSNLTLTDRAMIANMTPETGATVCYFPVDNQTLEYLRLTGRTDELISLIENYYKTQGLFRTENTPVPEFSDTIELDINTIEASIAGPKRPQDRINLRNAKSAFNQSLIAPTNKRGFQQSPDDLNRSAVITRDGKDYEITHGSIVIAAITSCTNTSNPYVMIGAGLVAKNALEKGLSRKPFIKSSLAPGSRVVTSYLEKANLLEPLSQLGFHIVGYGCTTCIGNSGPLAEDIVKGIQNSELIAASVLSGNRNFEGRVSPHTQANYLASPPLVVAYALAGTVDIDILNEPLGIGKSGEPVYLEEIWPSSHEIQQTIDNNITPDIFISNYQHIESFNEIWNAIESKNTALYDWDTNSTYIQEPPFFDTLDDNVAKSKKIQNARVLAVLGDSITTDHISPAGAIPTHSVAGQYLQDLGVNVSEFNSFGSRRGNDNVLSRGTFGNIRLKNLMVPDVEGSFTKYLPENKQMPIYDAAMKYKQTDTPLIILAGKEYGTGSSRDWAAKGPLILGVQAVIAESFERIHRSNLVGMGVLPIQFKPGDNVRSLGLSGDEVFFIDELQEDMPLRSEIQITVTKDDQKISFYAIVRLDTRNELRYYFNGGILNTILSDIIEKQAE
jgi:aconitate hydratase